MSTGNTATVRWLAGIVLCFVPMIVLYLTPWSSAVPLVYLGILPAVVALECSVRVAAYTALLTPVSVFVGLMVSQVAWLAAVFIAAVCLGVAWSYTRGWEGAATYIASQAALAAISVPGTKLIDASPDTPASAAVVSAFVLLGGLWVAVVGHFLIYDLPHRAHEQPTTDDLYRFALTLTVLAVIGTLAAKLWLPGGHAWWVMLTILIVLQPGTAGTTSRTLHRVLGTLGGGLVAALVVNALGLNTLTTAIGVVIAIGSGIAYLKAPYWAFAALLTAALMCLSFSPETVIHGYIERAGFTVLAAIAVVIAMPLATYALRARSTTTV